MHSIKQLSRVESYALVTLILLKFGVAIFAPTLFFPDSGVYQKYADVLIEKGFSIQTLSLDSYQLFRTAGYPFIIALTKTIFGSYHECILNILQTSFSLYCFLILFNIQRHLFSSKTLSIIFIVFYISSRYTLYDISYLTDSFNASFFCLSLALLFCFYLNLTQNHKCVILFSSLLWAMSILFRPASLYLSFIPILILFFYFIKNKSKFSTCLLLTVLFCFPILSSYHLYCKWNQNRSGAYVLSTTGAVNWLWPMFNMKERKLHDSFQNGDILGKAFHNNFTDYTFASQMTLFNHLKDEMQLNHMQTGDFLFKQLKHNITMAPIAFFRNACVNIYYTRMARLLFDPIRKLDQFLRFGLKLNGLHGIRAQWNITINEGGFINLIIALLYSITQVSAVLLFSIFIMGVPFYSLFQIIKFKKLYDSLAISLFMWIAYSAMCFGYALIHFEMRMALPVLMFPLFGLIALIQSLRNRY